MDHPGPRVRTGWRVAESGIEAEPRRLPTEHVRSARRAKEDPLVTLHEEIFPAGGTLPRHPVQLYEAFLQGPVLFALLLMLRSRTTRPGEIGIAFMLVYAVVRFITEFVRQPDTQTNFLWHGFTVGQILCLIMFGAGIGLLIYSRSREEDG